MSHEYDIVCLPARFTKRVRLTESYNGTEIQDNIDMQSNIKDLQKKYKNLDDKVTFLMQKEQIKSSIFNANYIGEKHQYLSAKIKDELIGGNTMIGVRAPSYYIKNNKEFKKKTSTMCFFYMSGECMSYSNVIIFNTNKEGTNIQKTIKLSDMGEKIHLSFLAKLENRNLTINDLGNHIRKFMICANCVKVMQFDNKFLFNYHKKTETCQICKIVSASKNIGNNKLCAECCSANGSGYEKLLNKALKPLVSMFKEELDTNYNINVSIRNNEDKRVIDALISGKTKNNKFFIMIEKDENQHKGYKKEKELKKIITQINALKHNKENVLIIRYSSIGNVDKKECIYDHLNKLIILRQWIIVYFMLLLKNNQPDNDVMLYMWYDQFDSKEMTDIFKKKYKKNINITQINHAPRCIDQDWKYKLEPSEKTIELIENNAIEVDGIIEGWHIV